MSEPLKKPDYTPEGYDPREVPEIVSMAQVRNSQAKEVNAMQQPIIITKQFRLAGFEAKIDLKESHWQGMDYVKDSLKASLEKISNQTQPIRFFGIWLADPDANYKKKKNHSKRRYFYGVEAASLDGLPDGFVTKDFPETTYAVFKSRSHGLPIYDWLGETAYQPDRAFQEKHLLDMEIFNHFDDVDRDSPSGDMPWDMVIPVRKKEEPK